MRGSVDGYRAAGGVAIRLGGYGCTGGFKWKKGSEYYLITAGHCGAYADWVHTLNGDLLGVVTDPDNWTNGSRKVQGALNTPPEPRYSGDILFVQLTLESLANPIIYSGGPNGNVRWKVVGTATNYRANYGERVCSGDQKTRDICRWKVTEKKIRYKDKDLRVWTEEVVQADRYDGRCTINGDSDGPVYTKVSGEVWARGIISGSAKARLDGRCVLYFTNIAEARWLGNGEVGMGK